MLPVKHIAQNKLYTMWGYRSCLFVKMLVLVLTHTCL